MTSGSFANSANCDGETLYAPPLMSPRSRFTEPPFCFTLLWCLDSAPLVYWTITSSMAVPPTPCNSRESLGLSAAIIAGVPTSARAAQIRKEGRDTSTVSLLPDRPLSAPVTDHLCRRGPRCSAHHPNPR